MHEESTLLARVIYGKAIVCVYGGGESSLETSKLCFIAQVVSQSFDIFVVLMTNIKARHNAFDRVTNQTIFKKYIY